MPSGGEKKKKVLPQLAPLGGEEGPLRCVTDCWAGGSDRSGPRAREGFADLLEDAADSCGSLFCFCPFLPPPFPSCLP